MTAPVRWGIASTGKISNAMAEALAGIADAEIVAVGSRTQQAAEAFAQRHGIARAYASHEALCADADVDLVYIGSPHSEHHDMTISALEAGRHVLCEKAFARNRAEAEAMVDAARRTDRFLMEAMWSWFMPAWHDLRHRVESGVIGEVVTVEANFCIPITDPDGRHRRPELAGGALLDLGIYPLALGRFLLGEPDDPERDVRAVATLTDAGVDGTLAGAMRHRSGAITVFSTSIDATSDRDARIVGTTGSIHVEAPFWFPSAYTIRPGDGGEPQRIELPNRGLAHEAEHVIERIRGRHVESDIQTFEATLANMSLMDEIRRQVGVSYPGE